MYFRSSLSKFWDNVQYKLIPSIEHDIGPLSEECRKLIGILELVRIEEFIPSTRFNFGRPRKDRVAIARAFITKIVLKITYTKQLIANLRTNSHLRRICGWEYSNQVPSESKFSRAFNEFSQTALPERVHAYLIKGIYKDKIIQHVVIDTMPLEVREKAIYKGSAKERLKIKQQKRNEIRKGAPNRREMQLKENSLELLLKDLPKSCDKGMKKSSLGYTEIWKGYKLHTACDDNCVPVAALITSASLNDCEAAIPLAKKANSVVHNLYDLMDAAYDHPEIKQYSLSLGHKPIIDPCPKSLQNKCEKEAEKSRKKLLNFLTAEDKRYKQRLPKERFNALYKDYHGGRIVYYKGFNKVFCHVMFGILTLAASTIIKLIQ